MQLEQLDQITSISACHANVCKIIRDRFGVSKAEMEAILVAYQFWLNGGFFTFVEVRTFIDGEMSSNGGLNRRLTKLKDDGYFLEDDMVSSTLPFRAKFYDISPSCLRIVKFYKKHSKDVIKLFDKMPHDVKKYSRIRAKIRWWHRKYGNNAQDKKKEAKSE